MARYIKTLPNGMLLVQLASGLMGKVQDRCAVPRILRICCAMHPDRK